MRLVFVYNAKTGLANSVKDILQKTFNPKAYSCSLCVLTHGVFLEKTRWRRFTESANVDFLFFHKDEFERLYRSKWLPKFEYPIILTDQDGVLEVFADKTEIDATSNTAQLIHLIQERLDRC